MSGTRGGGGAFLPLIGGTLAGALLFSGTIHAGLALNNLTTTQRNALVSPATGSLIANTTTAKPNYYDGTNWLEVPAYNSGTITTSQPFTLTQTWNAGGVTFNGWKLAITDTASAAASRPLNILGGASATTELLYLTVAGRLYAGAPAYAVGSPHYSSVGNTDTGFSITATGVYYSINGASVAAIIDASGPEFLFGSTTAFGWGSGAADATTADVKIVRDAANTLAQRNGANAQTFNGYYSFTDASNYQRFALKTGATTVEFAAETAGTGADNIDVKLTPAGTGVVSVSGPTNGQLLNLETLTESHTLAAAGTSDTTIQIPANALVIGVTARVTTTITGCTTFDIGVAGATTRYGTGILLTANTTNTSPGTTNPTIYGAAVSIRFTAVGGGASFSAGVIRVTIHYIRATAATS